MTTTTTVTPEYINCGRCGTQHRTGECRGMLGNGFGGDRVTFSRRDRVVYLGDDAHRGMVGEVTRVGLEVLGEPAVEVVFRHGFNGRRASRKQIRVSRLARAEAVS